MSKTRLLSPDSDGIGEAALLLESGRLVAFPTETVYGLGADATSDAAVAAIFAAKDRPSFNPLIVHVRDVAAAERLVEFNDPAMRLAAVFWPGALTLVLPRRNDCPVSLLASAGLDSLAVRVPDHPVAQALLRSAACPVAAPSANLSECLSPTTAFHVLDQLDGRIDAVLDGGPCRVGLESTVVDLCGEYPVLLRPGGVAIEDIEKLVGALAPAGEGDAPRSPGQMARHYAPCLRLRMNACCPADGEALLAFGPAPAEAALNLSPSGDLAEAAANLFAMLRILDDPGKWSAIAVRPIPDHGLGRAINDRLRRAASF